MRRCIFIFFLRGLFGEYFAVARRGIGPTGGLLTDYAEEVCLLTLFRWIWSTRQNTIFTTLSFRLKSLFLVIFYEILDIKYFFACFLYPVKWLKISRQKSNVNLFIRLFITYKSLQIKCLRFAIFWENFQNWLIKIILNSETLPYPYVLWKNYRSDL